jgi:hypothetical protein
MNEGSRRQPDEYHVELESDAYEDVCAWFQTFFQRQRVDAINPDNKTVLLSTQLAPGPTIGRSIAAFMCRDVHQVAAFMHKC